MTNDTNKEEGDSIWTRLNPPLWTDTEGTPHWTPMTNDGNDKPRTVTVRIAVAVDPSGHWNGYGHSGLDDQDVMHHVCETGYSPVARVQWVTAELPIPEVAEVAGEVENG